MVRPERDERSVLYRNLGGNRFEPVANARAILATWLRWMDEGRRRPLPLFCSAARVYAVSRLDGELPAEALARARKAFVTWGRTPNQRWNPPTA